MSDAPLPDAGTNWVDRRAPEGLKPWLKLGRFDRPIGIWLLLLPGWQGIALALAMFRRTPGLYELWLFIGFAIGAALMRAAGCAYNDIVDRDIDAQVARTAQRPIPSGRISVKQAWLFLIGCSLTSLLILLTLNWSAIALGVVSLALVAAYPFMKRITWWPQAWLGLTFNWGALMGFAASVWAAAAAHWAELSPPFTLIVSDVLDSGGPLASWLQPNYLQDRPALYFGLSWGALVPPVLLYLGGVFWTLGYDTIYALQDIEDDAMIGVKSSARRLGASVRRGVWVFYLLAVVFALLAGAAAGLGPFFYVGVLAYALHLAWQARRLKPDDPALALKLFKSNREAGLILLAAIVMGAMG